MLNRYIPRQKCVFSTSKKAHMGNEMIFNVQGVLNDEVLV